MRTTLVCGGLYTIREDGKVFRMKDGDMVELKHSSRSYYSIPNKKGEKPAYLPIHRLIAKAFVPNPENLPYVNHIDGNKHNNAASNLEWVSPRDNVILAYCLGQRHNKNYLANRERYETIIQERYGKTISEVLNGGK